MTPHWRCPHCGEEGVIYGAIPDHPGMDRECVSCDRVWADETVTTDERDNEDEH